MSIVITVAVFVAVLCILEGAALFLRNRWDPEARRVQRQLKALLDEAGDPNNQQATDITRKRILSSIPSLNDLLVRIPQLSRIDNLLLQSNFKYPTSVFLLLSLLLGFIGFFVGHVVSGTLLFSLPFALLIGLVPYFIVAAGRRRKMRKFERQLPDALDLVARSLRAGHAFSGGLQMVADEFDRPWASNFRGRLHRSISG
jgi:tight adherence protein B